MKLFDWAWKEGRSLWKEFNLDFIKIGNSLGYTTNPIFKPSIAFYPLTNKFSFYVDLFNYKLMGCWIAIAFGNLLEDFLQDSCDESIELIDLYISDDKNNHKKWEFIFRANDLVSLMKQGKIPVYKVIKEEWADEEIFEKYLEDNENSDKEDIRNDIVNMIKDTIEDIINGTDDLQRIKDRYQEDKSKKYQIDTEDIIVKYPKDKENSDKEGD